MFIFENSRLLKKSAIYSIWFVLQSIGLISCVLIKKQFYWNLIRKLPSARWHKSKFAWSSFKCKMLTRNVEPRPVSRSTRNISRLSRQLSLHFRSERLFFEKFLQRYISFSTAFRYRLIIRAICTDRLLSPFKARRLTFKLRKSFC